MSFHLEEFAASSKRNSHDSKKKDSECQSTNHNGARRKENPKSFQARLERGLKSLSTKTAGYRIKKCKTASTSKNMASKVTDVDGSLYIGGKSDNKTGIVSTKLEEDEIGDTIRLKLSSVSMRQLYSMAESWSSDSVASHSDSCTCCEIDKSNRRRPPCPVHGASSSFQKKIH